MTLKVGETVGSYRVIAQLGQGGMATVYKAYHANLDRYVAIKVLHPAFKEDTTFLARFQREARVLAKLEHPNIVPIYDFAQHEGQPYLVMKYIEGDTLKARLAQGPVTLAETSKVVDAVGVALAYAHKQGILHRDIKPSNVIITHDGFYYLSDFGLARIASAGESTLSQDTLLGTPNYISPEQAKGQRDLDGRTDIYSFGVVLYEMLCGRVPFSADTPFSVIHDHIYTPLPPPTSINPNISDWVEKFLLKALAKDRNDRFADAATMVTAFQGAIAQQPIQVQPEPVARPLKSKTGPATVKAPAPAPTVKAQTASPSQDKTVTQPAIAANKTNWPVIVGAIVLLVGLGLGGLLVARQVIQNTRLRQTATAFALVPTVSPTADAVGLAQTAVAINPNDGDAHLKLGDAYYQAGRTDDALGEYTKAAELAGYAPIFYIEHIVPRFGESNPVMALTLVADGLRHNESARMWAVATPLIERVSQRADGGPVLETLAQDHPDRPAVIAGLARYYILQDQLDKAQPIVDGLRRDYPDEAATHLINAEYLVASGDTAGAMAELQLVISNRRLPLEVRRLAENRLNELKGTPTP